MDKYLSHPPQIFVKYACANINLSYTIDIDKLYRNEILLGIQLIMIINWDIFKAKHSGREEKVFEELCYHLFCYEYNQPCGIFNYKNQIGLECNPIKVNDEWIGFQAKYFKNKVKKEDIIDSIKKTKQKYPYINKILLYINGTFGQSTKKYENKPKDQKEIESFAYSQKIELIWQVQRNIEHQLIRTNNKFLFDICFSLEKDINDFIEEINIHSKNNLEKIETEIKFNDYNIKIDRTNIIENLKNKIPSEKFIVISGIGGCGKTAIIKELYTIYDNERIPIFVFKANEFNNRMNINDLFSSFGRYTLNDFIEYFQSVSKKVIVIDSAEKVFYFDSSVFKIFMDTLVKNNWIIIFTIRSAFLDKLSILIEDNIEPILVPKITEKYLIQLSKFYKFTLPEDRKLCDLLRLPFYLSEYLSSIKSFSSKKALSINNFKEYLWENQIMSDCCMQDNMNVRREKTFLSLIEQKIKNINLSDNDCDNKALSCLQQDDIITYNKQSGSYFITHDIYEEWGIEKFIDKCYIKNKSNYKNFLESMDLSFMVRYSFSNWLSDKLLENTEEITTLIKNIIDDNSISNLWKDEVLVVMMLSDLSQNFYFYFKEKLLENNQALLLRIIPLLRIACKDVDYKLIEDLSINKKELNYQYFITIPKGSGWKYTIQFIYENIYRIDRKNLKFILELLSDWVAKISFGDTTKYVGKIALHYFNNVGDELDREYLEKVIKIMLKSSNEIKKEVIDIIDKILNGNNGYKYNRVVEIILQLPIEINEVIMAIPSKIIELMNYKLVLQEKDVDITDYCLGFNYNRLDKNYNFGLTSLDFFPPSALRTPTYFLLTNDFEETIDFIISFINEATIKYVSSELAKKYDEIEKIKIYISNNVIVEQFSSHLLWNMYRGHSDSPHVMQSMLMALEKFLLRIVNNDKYEIEEILIKLLSKSKSIAITAVITSIVIANYGRLYNVAKILFKTKELFNYDLYRKNQEGSEIYSWGFVSEIDKIAIMESDKLEHRKLSLENIAIYYQIFNIENCPVEIKTRQQELCKIWDAIYNALPTEKEQTEKDINIRCLLKRIDYRNFEEINSFQDKNDNQIYLSIKSKQDEHLNKKIEPAQKQVIENTRYMELKIWSKYKYENKTQKRTKYDNTPILAYNEMIDILNKFKNNVDFRVFYETVPIFVSAVLLRDFANILSKEQKNTCKNIILNYASILLNPQSFFHYPIGIQPAIDSLYFVLNLFPNSKQEISIILIFALFNIKDIFNYAINCLQNIWNTDFDMAQNIWITYIQFKTNFELAYKKNNYGTLVENIKNYLNVQHHYTEIDKNILENRIDLLRAFIMLPNDSLRAEHIDFSLKIISSFSRIFDNRKESKGSYEEKTLFSYKYARYLLSLPKENIKSFLNPFLQKDKIGDDFSELLSSIFTIQIGMKQYDNFWYVWKLLYTKIVESINNKFVRKKLVIAYMLAEDYINNNLKECPFLEQKGITFFYKIIKDIGKYSETLYAVARVFDGIAHSFSYEAIEIIYYLIQNYKYEKLEITTTYHLERIIRKYISINENKIRKDIDLKNKVIKILSFLVDNGSAFAYRLRDYIL